MDYEVDAVVRRSLLLLLCYFFSFAAWSQCPEAGAVSRTLSGGSIPELRILEATLVDCGEHPDSIADVQHKLGVKYARLNLDSAIYFTRQAVITREKHEKGKGSFLLGKSNFNLGEFLRSSGYFIAAERALVRSAEIYSRFPDGQGGERVVRSQATLQQVYIELGEYGKAEEVYRLGRMNADKFSDTLRLAYLMHNRANMLRKQGELEAAEAGLTALNDSLARWMPSASPTLNWYLEETNIYQHHDQGVVLMELGHYIEAEEAYNTAIPVLEAWNDHDNLSRAYHDLTYQRIEQGRLAEAIHFLRLEKKEAEQSGNARNLAFYHNNKGAYALKAGNFAEAASFFQQAQSVLVPSFEPEKITDAPAADLITPATDLPYLIVNLQDQLTAMDSLIANGQDLRQQELSLYRAADQLVDLLRTSHDSRASKLFWRQKVLSLYESAIARCHELKDGVQAFYFFEKSKAILLHEELLRNNALATLPDSLRTLERQLTAHVISLSKKQDPESLQELASTRTQQENLRETLQQNYPAYKTLTGSLPEVKPSEFINRILAPSGQIYVHYFWGTKQVYALLYGSGNPRIVDLGPAAELEVLTRKMLVYFTSASDIENNPAGYTAAAYRLHQRILYPLGLADGTPLLINPDGPLTYLPFPALLTEAATTNSFGKLPYLLHDHEISYCHSAAALLRDRQELNEPASIAAFAPFTDGSSALKYPVLSFSNDEIQAIGQQFKTTVFRDGRAQAAPFLTEQNAEVLHLSSHAFSSPADDAPRIAFHDRLLYLSELYTAEVSAELVVLSACQTNVGKLAPGEGVLGLSRGFVQAGAGSVVASLWNVNARAGGQVLTAFYEELGQGVPRGTALHRAQHRYLSLPGTRDRAKNPYYWAGLTYYGTNQSLPLQSAAGFNWWWLLWLLPISLLLTGVMKR